MNQSPPTIKDLPESAITGNTLAFLATQYSGDEHGELWKRVTVLLSEINRLREHYEKCPLTKGEHDVRSIYEDAEAPAHG